MERHEGARHRHAAWLLGVLLLSGCSSSGAEPLDATSARLALTAADRGHGVSYALLHTAAQATLRARLEYFALICEPGGATIVIASPLGPCDSLTVKMWPPHLAPSGRPGVFSAFSFASDDAG